MFQKKKLVSKKEIKIVRTGTVKGYYGVEFQVTWPDKKVTFVNAPVDCGLDPSDPKHDEYAKVRAEEIKDTGWRNFREQEIPKSYYLKDLTKLINDIGKGIHGRINTGSYPRIKRGEGYVFVVGRGEWLLLQHYLLTLTEPQKRNEKSSGDPDILDVEGMSVTYFA